MRKMWISRERIQRALIGFLLEDRKALGERGRLARLFSIPPLPSFVEGLRKLVMEPMAVAAAAGQDEDEDKDEEKQPEPGEAQREEEGVAAHEIIELFFEKIESIESEPLSSQDLLLELLSPFMGEERSKEDLINALDIMHDGHLLKNHDDCLGGVLHSAQPLELAEALDYLSQKPEGKGEVLLPVLAGLKHADLMALADGLLALPKEEGEGGRVDDKDFHFLETSPYPEFSAQLLCVTPKVLREKVRDADHKKLIHDPSVICAVRTLAENNKCSNDGVNLQKILDSDEPEETAYRLIQDLLPELQKAFLLEVNGGDARAILGSYLQDAIRNLDSNNPRYVDSFVKIATDQARSGHCFQNNYVHYGSAVVCLSEAGLLSLSTLRVLNDLYLEENCKVNIRVVQRAMGFLKKNYYGNEARTRYRDIGVDLAGAMIRIQSVEEVETFIENMLEGGLLPRYLFSKMESPRCNCEFCCVGHKRIIETLLRQPSPSQFLEALLELKEALPEEDHIVQKVYHHVLFNIFYKQEGDVLFNIFYKRERDCYDPSIIQKIIQYYKENFPVDWQQRLKTLWWREVEEFVIASRYKRSPSASKAASAPPPDKDDHYGSGSGLFPAAGSTVESAPPDEEKSNNLNNTNG